MSRIEAIKKIAAQQGLLGNSLGVITDLDTGGNWRPQILILCKLNPTTGQVTTPRLLDLASHLKNSGGLAITASVLHGDLLNRADAFVASAMQASLEMQMKQHKLRGFAQVVVGSGQGLVATARILLQTQGLGLLTPNTVMVSWPLEWRESNIVSFDGGEAKNLSLMSEDQAASDLKHKTAYVDLLKSGLGAGKALIVVKGVNHFPGLHEEGEASGGGSHLHLGLRRGLHTHAHKVKKVTGFIDIWWLVHDGDLLVLIPYLLMRHRVWKHCQLRLFAVAPGRFSGVSWFRSILGVLHNIFITMLSSTCIFIVILS